MAAVPPRIGGLVLAAGASRRFGSPKQLACHRGRPLLEHALAAMAAAEGLERRAVVLGAGAAQVREAVDLHGFEVVVCEDWEEGQAASLRAGVAALADTVDAVVVTLGDQPEIDPRAIERILRARDGRSDAIRATYGGRPGHPVLLEAPLLRELPRLRGDAGARGLLATAAVALVACDGLGSDLDIDLPEQIDG